MRTDRSAVVEKEEFQVTIKDQDSQPVEDALVFIDPDGIHISTDAQGIAYLDAPEVPHNKNITIKTTKDGYINSSTSILVETTAGVMPTLGDGFLIQIAPILFAAVAVLFAVLYVRWRKRTQRDLPPKQTTPNPPLEKSPEISADPRKRYWENEPASYPIAKRGATSLSSSDSKVEEIRIPLQKNEGKWFEAERDIQSKVDEALKKQSKKKKVDQHDIK
jgi:hypothetical protein